MGGKTGKELKVSSIKELLTGRQEEAIQNAKATSNKTENTKG